MKYCILFVFLLVASATSGAQTSEDLGRSSKTARPVDSKARLSVGCRAYVYDAGLAEVPGTIGREMTGHSSFVKALRQGLGNVRLFVGIAIPFGIALRQRVVRRNPRCRPKAITPEVRNKVFPVVAFSCSGRSLAAHYIIP